MADELLDLIERFEPTNKDRHVQYSLNVYKGRYRHREINVTAVGYFNSISSGGTINNPLQITDHSLQGVYLWLSGDKKIVKKVYRPRHWGPRFEIVKPDDLTTDDRASLIMGLKGDYTTLDEEFQELRRAYLTSVVDGTINKLRQESNMWKLSRINLENPQFSRLRRQLLKSLNV
jgi:hypothetical protein